MSKTWSPLQTAIFNLIEDPNGGNAIIEADVAYIRQKAAEVIEQYLTHFEKSS